MHFNPNHAAAGARRRTLSMFALLSLLATCPPPAWSVQPKEWVHQTEADFSQEETEDTIVTNLGEVQLARETSRLASLDGDNSIVYDIARLSDRTFLAIGPRGKLAELEGETTGLLAEYEDAQVFSLTADEGGLWVGVSGASSRLEYRSGERMEVQRTIELPEVRYVWDVLASEERLWIATGAKGRVYTVDKASDAAKPEIALDTAQDNVLCLGMDGEGRVYAGTDGEGLIHRIAQEDGGYKTFVVYDAGEPEIGALLVLEDGTVYAGTADAEEAKPGRMKEAIAEATGRAEAPVEEPSEPPEVPNVPPEPNPQDASDDAGEKAGEDENGGAEERGAASSESAAAAEEAVAEEDQRPGEEQYDRLRQMVRAQLAEARESGTMELQTSAQARRTRAVAARVKSQSSSHSSSNGSSKEGNAVYRIDPDGFVREVFRESVMILNLARRGENLLIATGNEGQIYRSNPGTNEITTLADLDPQQIPAMFDVGGGKVLLGTANPARVVRLSEDYAREGKQTSEPLDAEQISLWGKMRITAKTPENTALAVRTRSGNVSDPDLGSWSSWSEPHRVRLNHGQSAYIPVESSSARFLQYRLILRSEGKTTPVVNGFALKYLTPNLRPRIASIHSEYGESENSSRSEETDAPAPQRTLKVEWEASDPNDDELTYTLEARPFAEEGPFLAIAEDLDDEEHEWNTQTTADGRYVLRVTASDAPDNVSDQAMSATRRSDPVVVDNTAPKIEDAALDEGGRGDTYQLTATITDNLSPIAAVRYSVDSDKKWRLVLPDDAIYDSTEESISVKLDDLSEGRHVITIRAIDGQSNSRYFSRTLNVSPQ